jgi:hypothetical protein
MIEGFDYIPTGTGSTYSLMMAGQWYPRGSVFGSLTQNILGASSTAFGYGCCYEDNRTYAQTFNAQRWVYPVGTQTEGYMGARVMVGSDHNGYGYLFVMDGISELGQIYVTWEDYGKIKVYRDEPPTSGGGILLGSTDIGAYYYDKWFYLEVYVKMGNTDGRVTVKINTVTVLDLVNVDTVYSSNASFSAVGFGNANSVGNTGAWKNNYRLDDLYFCDPAGTINNGFLGNVRAMALLPVSNGSVNNFAIGGSAPAATNWQSVLTTALNDTKYVYSNNVGDKDLYNVQAIVNAPLVHGVQVKIAARMDDATQRGLAAMIKSGGVEVEGITHYINQSYSFYRTIHELDPATGVGWTGAAVNLIQIGPKVVS